jgi:hypothetical protein
VPCSKKKPPQAESGLPFFGSCLELGSITPSFSFLSLSLRIFLILHTQTLNLENCMSSCNVVWNLLKSAMVRETCLSKNIFSLSAYRFIQNTSAFTRMLFGDLTKGPLYHVVQRSEFCEAADARKIRLVDTWCLEDYLVEGERRMLSPA